jgi:putative ABC transport system ATP-binding protein
MAIEESVPNLRPRLDAMFRAILAPDRSFFWQAIVFSIAISVLTLAVPLSVQILISSVANIALTRPVVVLAGVLFGLLALYGLLVAIQAYLMDVFERRLFARITKEIALRSIHARYADVESMNREELANRFFEIITIQRNVPSLLITGSAIVLQAIVGFAVVSGYHPVFAVFNTMVLLLAFLIWKIWAGGAIRTKLASSQAKFNVASWLEELGRANAFFKSSRHVRLALETSEERIAEYVGAHRRHFRMKFSQQIGFLALYASASASLLGLGGWLVVSNQLTLGQLVAAELILSAVFVSFARVPYLLEEYYEVCAALYKLGDFFDVPLELPIDGEDVPAGSQPLRFLGVKTHHRDREFRFDLEIPAGAKMLAVASSFSMQRGLLNLVMRHTKPAAGEVRLGEHNIADLHLHQLRDGIMLIDNSGVLERTVEENLRLGDASITRTDMRAMLAVVGMDAVINALPQGLDTTLGAFGYPLSRSETTRLKIAAALLARPKVLIVDQIFDSLSNGYRRAIVDEINKRPELTFINFSNRRDVPSYGEYLYIEPDRHHRFATLAELVAFERRFDEDMAVRSGETR